MQFLKDGVETVDCFIVCEVYTLISFIYQKPFIITGGHFVTIFYVQVQRIMSSRVQL